MVENIISSRFQMCQKKLQIKYYTITVGRKSFGNLNFKTSYLVNHKPNDHKILKAD